MPISPFVHLWWTLVQSTFVYYSGFMTGVQCYFVILLPRVIIKSLPEKCRASPTVYTALVILLRLISFFFLKIATGTRYMTSTLNYNMNLLSMRESYQTGTAGAKGTGRGLKENLNINLADFKLSNSGMFFELWNYLVDLFLLEVYGIYACYFAERSIYPSIRDDSCSIAKTHGVGCLYIASFIGFSCDDILRPLVQSLFLYFHFLAHLFSVPTGERVFPCLKFWF